MTVENELRPSRKAIIALTLAGTLAVSIPVVLLRWSSQGLLYVLAGILVLLAGGILAVRPWLGTYLVVLSFPFVAAMPRGAYIPGLKPDEVLIIVSLLASLVSPSVKGKFRLTKMDHACLITFLIGAVLPMLGVLARGQSPDWFEVIALLKPYALYRLIVMTLNNRAHISRAVVLLLLPSLLVSVVALLQLLDVAGIPSLLSGIYFQSSAPFAVSRYRATATLGNWNALGGYAALGALLSLALTWHRKALTMRWLAPIALAANLSALLLAGSSSSIAGFIGGAFVLWFAGSKRVPKRQKRITYLLVASAVGLIVTITPVKTVLHRQFERQAAPLVFDRATGRTYPTYGVPTSVASRWHLARYLFGLMAEDELALLTGFGPGENAMSLLPWTSAESGYVTMLFFYGPLFALAYLVLWGVIVFQARRVRKRLKMDDELGFAITTTVISITVAMGLMTIISSYYKAGGVTHYFWTVVGCMMVLQTLYIDHRAGVHSLLPRQSN